MIIDRVENVELYTTISPRLAVALRALRDAALLGREPGKYELQGSDVFAMIQTYTTRLASEGKWETHRKYIDVQYVIEGVERIDCVHRDALKITEPYIPDRDVMFYEGDGNAIVLPAGSFAVFFPHDAHKPTLAAGNPAPVRKIVIKVAV